VSNLSSTFPLCLGLPSGFLFTTSCFVTTFLIAIFVLHTNRYNNRNKTFEEIIKPDKIQETISIIAFFIIRSKKTNSTLQETTSFHLATNTLSFLSRRNKETVIKHSDMVFMLEVQRCFKIHYWGFLGLRQVVLWTCGHPDRHTAELPAQSNRGAHAPLRQHHFSELQRHECGQSNILFSMVIRGQFIMFINTHF